MALWLAAGAVAAPAACTVDMPEAPAPGAAMGVAQWIARMQRASLSRDYSGTFMVLSGNGAMASSRIWHVCEGPRQVERIEALSGAPRVVYRRDGEVRTFLPQARLVRNEMRDGAGLFPRVSNAEGVSPASHYTVETAGQERVAGLAADVLTFIPRDAWRFGYRIWAEHESGLAVKLQTLDAAGRVLEQAAFSELTMRSPMELQSLLDMMDDLAGYRVVTAPLVRTTAQAEGWRMRAVVDGFAAQGCYKKQGTGQAGQPPRTVLQCIYSDGLATLSVFLEPYGAARHPQGGRRLASMGATQVLGQKVDPDTWATAVGEVPLPTLQRFVDGLERIGSAP
jgi:sigma-E factor negative regulatory protein RseB